LGLVLGEAAVRDEVGDEVVVATVSDEAALPEEMAAERTGREIGGTLPFLIAFGVQILTFWTVDIVAPATPDIKDDLGLSATGAGLIFSLFFFGRLVTNLPAAYLLSRIGTVATAMIGGLLVLGGSILASTATSQAVLFPARVLQGAGVAVIVAASLVSLLRVRPDRGAAMTYFGFGSTIGGVFGLATGGVLTEWVSWRAVFVLSAAIGIAIIAAVFSARRSLVQAVPARAVAASDPDELEESAGRGLLASYVFANFLGFFNYFVWIAISLYADKKFDASAGVVSALLLVVTFVHLFAAFPAGRMIRLRGGRQALIAGLVLSTSGTLLILVPNSAILLALPLIPYGIGQVLVTNAAGDLVLHLGGRGRQAIGIMRLSSDIGLVVGPWVSGALMDAVGYGAPFAILPLISIGAALFFWRGVGRFSRPAVA
jgi:MFS family permease